MLSDYFKYFLHSCPDRVTNHSEDFLKKNKEVCAEVQHKHLHFCFKIQRMLLGKEQHGDFFKNKYKCTRIKYSSLV